MADLSLLFSIYFPNEPVELNPTANTPIQLLTERCHQFFVEDIYGQGVIREARNNVLSIELESLHQDIREIFQARPDFTLDCLCFAAHAILLGNRSEDRTYVRVHCNSRFLRFSKLTSAMINKFVTVRGTILRVEAMRAVLWKLPFKCTKCGAEQILLQQDGDYHPPSQCSGKCRSNQFEPIRESAVTRDFQRLRVQELRDGGEQGRVPPVVDVDVMRGLGTDGSMPGDVVTVSGIVRKARKDWRAGFGGGGGKGSAGNRNEFDIYIHALSCDRVQIGNDGDLVSAGVISAPELEGVNFIAQSPDPLRLVANSICPLIFGHEIVKAGIALTLMGGSFDPNSNLAPGEEKSFLGPRSDCHMLVVGDPGMGKSQMLRAASFLSPRGVYVCGNVATASGLTVTVTKESHGDFTLEAGALVLADRGLCCIDELDKMSAIDHTALLEAMEQQQCSVAKAGIVCNLPSRCSILAAANPVDGHYTRGKTIAENLKMRPALLSRFDLIYVLMDRSQERDADVSRYILHSPAMRGSSLPVPPSPSAVSSSSFSGWVGMTKQEGKHPQDGGDFSSQSLGRAVTLAHRLRIEDDGSFQPIPPVLLRQYFRHCRAKVQPLLSPQAAKLIQDFYLQLRQSYRHTDSTPITTRQLQSMIRLSQARAKMALRNEVTEADAKDVIALMRESLYDICLDEGGHVEVARVVTGMSKAKQKQAYLKALESRAAQNQGVFTVAELRDLADSMQVTMTQGWQGFVDSLNYEGYLLNKGNGLYKFAPGGNRSADM